MKTFRGALAPPRPTLLVSAEFSTWQCTCTVGLHLQWRLGISSAAMSTPNGLLSQKAYHYLNQCRTLNNILMKVAH